MPKRRRPSPARTSPMAALSMLLVAGMAFLGAAEVVLRIINPGWSEFHSGRFMTPVRVPGHFVVYTGLPGFDGWFSQNNGDFRSHIRINAFGLRNDEPVEAAQGRLWVVGDSFSFGWGVERAEMYTQVIGDSLGIATYNVAAPGASVCGWQALVDRMPKSVKPGLVVVGLTVENRIGVYDCPALAESVRQAPQEPKGIISFIAMKKWLTGNLALYNFITVSVKRVGVVQRLMEETGLIADPNARDLHVQNVARIPDMITSTTHELVRLKAMLPEGTPFVVVTFPARQELGQDNAYFRDLRQGAEAALAEQGITVISLIEPFKAAGAADTHFRHDGHWNALGHKIAGQAIARELASRGLATYGESKP